MAARDDHSPDLTIEIPPPAPEAPTRFERVTGERADIEEHLGVLAAVDHEIDFAVTAPRTQPTTKRAHTPRRSRDMVTPPLDDEFIDQFSGLVNRRLYLRLARTGAFPTRQIGQKLVARWGDVRRALAPEDRRVDEDRIDRLRRQIGLAPRGGP